jgi:predicted Zn-dependent protease
MKSLLLFLTLTVPLAAQTANREFVGAIGKTCSAAPMARIDSFASNPVATDNEGNALPEGDTLADPIFVRSTERLLPVFKSSYPNVRVVIAVTSSSVINAFAAPTFGTDPTNGTRVALVCIPNEFIRFMGEEDELAFMIAHELGHTVDEACRQRTQVTRTNQVICEQRADEIGYFLARQAGYSPYAAAGAFGRLEMYYGDTSTGLTGLFRQLGIDHPITPNRITNMRRLLLSETHQ